MVILEATEDFMPIKKLIKSLPELYSPKDIELINHAYDVAEKAHRPQKRVSGEPYINHCLAVATILSDLKVPPVVVAAGLLHDTVEDTPISIEDLTKEFGEEIANLVDGVTKLTQLPRVSQTEELIEGPDGKSGGSKNGPKSERANRRVTDRRADLTTENLRKTFLAMGEDIRVVLIKLADRLHNMRTLGHMPEHKRKRIAKETLDIFAPLASRLGIWQIKWELEDIAFRYSDPDTYKEIAKNLDERRTDRESQVEDIVEKLNALMIQNGLEVEVNGRPKHIYSIYKKMNRKDVSFDLVRDIRAVRIVVEDVPACYSVLGIIHSQWRPLPGEFDDYIAGPKDNFYQSLHTAVIYEDGKTLEVQIRSKEMHENAEYGIAAHWRYKEGSQRDEMYERRIVYLRQLMDWMQEVEDAGEYVDSMKTDVFGDRVYAFTPNGDIIDLPAGSTPLDFAYHVHTEVGHRCRGAKINGKLVPLDYVLKTGDQVEILTAKRGGPSRDWLNNNLRLLNTNRGRSKVRQWFRWQDREENIQSGKAQFEREIRRLNISNVNIGEIASDFNLKTADDVYLALGIGDIGVTRIVHHIADTDETDESFEDFLGEEDLVTYGEDSVKVLGLKGLLTTMAKCCKPAPGDDIIGYITRGRGATIHRVDCPNVLRIKDRERLARVSWGEPKSTYPVSVRIKAYDRDGLMRDVSTVIANEGINMRQVKVDVNKSQAVFDIILEVGNINQLSRVLTVLENLPNIMEAQRINPG
jgi:GTP diphosphokinase / guanosine-3',5'-bis(diphosphate) 3'-diphosphatase